ncbi:non-ribosomal peptide synthetase/type I polyketide synthase [Magnetospirillum fulvum]|uniref:Amino acid adenylation domain-containing protein n=1 Tax=Magnetospirillum fulvum TaxID=1082 RepID=A0A1H6I667_MAGFU|nr:non-ribosomal peptide synthetase/type I polyketide synthase [Magnetospirillum fulvum]SEH43087.1 amino acid adenylation domain-containing protein [Magnetospirillum fulvum]
MTASGLPSTVSPGRPPAAETHGFPPLPPEAPVSLDMLLRRAAHDCPHAGLSWIGSGGASHRILYPDLLAEAERIAVSLRRAVEPGGAMILLQGDPHLILAGLSACLLGGLVAVPLLAPDQAAAALPRLRQVWETLGQPPILANDSDCDRLADLWPNDAAPPRLLPLSAALAGREGETPPPPAPAPGDIGLMLFTSGSTGQPKGVPLSHHGLHHALRGFDARFDLCAADSVFNWMPLDHVAGLAFLALGALLHGAEQSHIPTESVLKDPLRLLDGLDRSRAALAFVPNFIFTLVAERLETLDRGDVIPSDRWNLSHLRILISGGEAVDAVAARRFEQALARFGLRPGVLRPGFGMSEAGGGITFAEGLETCLVPGLTAQPVTGLGVPVPGLSLRIADDQGEVRPERSIGRVQIRTEALIEGYVNDAEATAEAFLDGWFDTGDLGFLDQGRLFLVGRGKDVLIVNGLNVASPEIEIAAETVQTIVPGQTAALGVRRDGSQTDQVALLFAPRDLTILPPDHAAASFWSEDEAERLAEMIAQIRGAVADRTGLALALCLPLPPDSLPRTSIGKIKRGDLQSDVQSGRFDRLSEAIARLEAAARPRPSTRSEQSAPFDSVTDAPLFALVAQVWRTVLGQECVAPDDSFLTLGGDSIAAARILEELGRTLGLDLPPALLFQAPTPAGLCRALADAIARRPGTVAATIPSPPPSPSSQADDPPVSFGQRGLWLLDRLDGPQSSYNNPVGLRLTGRLDLPALTRALELILARHEPLRTRIVAGPDQDEPVQRIDPVPPVLLDPVAVTAKGLDAAIRTLIDLPFALDRDHPIRIALFALEPDAHLLVLCLHHCASDGWSLALLLRELERAYGAFHAGSQPDLPPLGTRYAEFARWQRDPATANAAGLAYWCERLKDAPPRLDLPLDHPRRPNRLRSATHHRVTLSAAETARLRTLAAGRNTTLAIATLTGFALLLTRLSRQDRVVIGLPVANRPRPDLANLIGFFANTLAVPLHQADGDSFLERIERTALTVLDGLRHQDTPFEAVVEAVNPDRSLGHAPLFQVMFAYQSVVSHAPDLPGLEVRLEKLSPNSSPFDLFLSVEESEDGGLDCCLSADRGLFEPVTAARFAQSYRHILVAATDAAERPLDEIDLLPPEQRTLVMKTWQGGPPVGPDDGATLARLWADRACASPAATAVRTIEGDEIRCGTLFAESRALAWEMLRQGARPGQPVGLLLPRSVALVRASTAALLAGCPFVALDPAAPDHKIAQTAQAAGLRLAICGEGESARLAALGITALAPLAPDPAPDSFVPPGLSAHPDECAFLLFTSGSTGRPKGVVCTHRGIVNRLRWQWSRHPYRPGEICCLRAAVTFADSLAELFGPLLAGVPVVPLSDADIHDPDRLLARLDEIGATRLLLVPSLLALLLDAAPDLGRRLPRLGLISVSGEAMPADLLARLRRAAPNARLLNIYGSSEVSADVSWYEVGPDDPLPPDGTVPIGRPLPGNRIYVLDSARRPVPPGVPGILHVAGEQLARGYLDDPDQTAAAFPTAPDGERLFRTGDLGRFRFDGMLDYLGRDDFMISLHGLRIEPGEVEATLRAHPAVRDAAVTRASLPGGEPILAAFVVLDPVAGAGLTADSLHAFAAGRIARTMVPHRFSRIERLPLLSNGKLDRRALSALEPGETLPSAAASAAPSTPGETLVAQAMSEILGQAPASIHANFFTCGGHSLLAVRLAARIAALSGRDFPVERVFVAPTVAGLARWLDENGDDEATPDLPLVPRAAGSVPDLSPAQRGFWSRQLIEGAERGDGLAGGFDLSGPLNPDHLEAAIRAVVTRHLPLRTLHGEAQGQPLLTLLPTETAMNDIFAALDLSGLTDDSRQDGLAALETMIAAARFDLAAEPPLRLRLARLGPDQARLYFSAHHIAWDGWSTQVFLDELSATIAALAEGRQPALPPLPVSYYDYAAWALARERSGRFAADLAYWRQSLEGAPPLLDLASDWPRPARRDGRASVVRVGLDPATLAGLDALARRRGESRPVVLLAAFAALLAAHGGREDLVIGMVSANRNHPATHGLIGFFVNTLPLRLRLDRARSVADLLDIARGASHAAQAHAEPPFDRIVQTAKVERSLAYAPLVQCLFVHHNEPFAPPVLPGATATPYPIDPIRTGLDLVWETQPDAAGGLSLTVTAAADLFTAATIERLAAHSLTLCRALAETGASDRDWRALPLIPPEEQDRLGRLSQGAPVALPRPALIHDLIRRQALADPEAIALDGPAGPVTRGALDSRASAIAAAIAPHLPETGDALVALCLEPGPDFVACWLGLLQAGAAVLPLDPIWPPERIALILRQTAPVLLVTDPARSLPPLPPGTTRISPDRLATSPSARPPATPGRTLPADGRSLAYVIATSGTTGAPKAVAVEHRSLVNLALAQADLYGIGPATRALLLVSPAFDVAMGELATLLCAGGTLVLADRLAIVPGRELVELLKAYRVTHLSLPPSALAALPPVQDDLPDLACLVLGGEACPQALAERWSPGRTLFNAYGPTEATVCATATRLTTSSDIGRPLPNVQAFCLDAAGRPTAPGVAGELYLGGIGLARGYLGRDDLTQAVFIAHPLGAEGRLYRTGDRVRRREDGGLDFLGRRDDQVKIRGVRIEPIEVAALLDSFPEVAQSVVVPRAEGGTTLLVACYVPARAEGPSPTAEELRQRLKERLPPQAVPDRIVRLDALPLTANGKIDTAALPLAAPTPPPPRPARGLPAARLRPLLAEIWREVLGREVGERENFFDAGGHSLLVAQVQSLIEQRCQHKIAAVDLFRHPTIASLAEALEPSDGASAPEPEAVPSPRDAAEPIAVIGMACRLPGAPDLPAFAQALRDGRELIGRFSDEELLAAGLDPAQLADPAYVRAGGFVADIDCFDAGFFGISPHEAAGLDPQQRVFFECAWHALEHAGHAPGPDGLSAALFAGTGANHYLALAYPDGPPLSEEGFAAYTGNGADFLATRTAYLLNLTGPAVTVQTACSTSLTAVAMACRALRQGEAEFALAGGVSLPLVPRGYLYRPGMIFSPDGHCRPFDAEARGTVPSGGCGLVVLRPLSAALADGDTIHAVIVGAAINNDGAAKAGYLAPGIAGQSAAIRAALAQAGLRPDQIGYVEAHGTGTELGDPIEVAALHQAYGPLAPGSIGLGAVKANLGHADAAAGVIGLIKTVLTVAGGEIPPTPHFTRPNPRIDFAAGPFFVPTRPMPWPKADGTRRAAVSSFGIGGTNAHVVVAQAEAIARAPLPETETEPGWRVVKLSAKSPAALEQLSHALAQDAGTVDFDDFCLTLARGRRSLPLRRAIVCRDKAAAADRLSGRGRPDPARTIEFSGQCRDGAPPLLFLLPGQGSQYPGMGRGLYRAEPVFARRLDTCREFLRPLLGRDILPMLLDPSWPESDLADTAATQPLLFALGLALADLLAQYRLAPAALLGHSLGELTAACVAGVISAEDGLRLVAERGRLMAAMEPGAMIATDLSEDEAGTLCQAHPGLAVAALNGPTACTLSGPVATIQAAEESLRHQGRPAHRLATSHAFHSALMAPAAEALAAFAATMTLTPPRLPVYSNLTGQILTADQATDPAYWARQMLAPVRFGAALAAAAADGLVGIEVGPGRALSGFAAVAGIKTVNCLRHAREDRDESLVFQEALARLWLAGAEPDFAAGLSPTARRVPLAAYPFARDRHWSQPGVAPRRSRSERAADSDPAQWLYVPSWRPQRASGMAASPLRFPRHWLLLEGADPLGEALTERIVARGGMVERVRPGDPDSPAARLTRLTTEGRRPEIVLHLWSLEVGCGEAETGRALDLSLFSLFDLAKALAEGDESAPCRIGLVSRGLHRIDGDESGTPFAAAALGLLKVLPVEQDNLTCRAVDIGMGAVDPDRLLDALLSGPEDGIELALRGRRRWLPGWNPRPLPPAEPSPLRRHGVYWITGGLGGVGLGLARELAARFQARLVLTSRTGLPDPGNWDALAQGEDDIAGRIRAIREIERLGGSVLVIAADCADAAAIEAAHAQATDRFGPLDGIIHAAGLADEAGMARRRKRADSLPVLAPKIAGTLALTRLLGRHDSRAFLVLCSSLGVALPGHKFAQAAYQAANQFMDAVADQAEGSRIVAIDWDDWTEDGMSVRAARRWRERHDGLPDSPPAPGLTAAQGFEVLSRVLGSGEPRVLVSVRDLFEMLAEDRDGPARMAQKLAPNPAQAGRHSRPDLATPYAPAATGTETALIGLWQEILGIEPVGADDDFFELGGHSLMATRLIGLIRERMGVSLPLGALFQAPTPRTAAALVSAAHPPADTTEESKIEEHVL